MATTINASASSGLITTADTSTVLQLQTAGTAAVTVDASQNVGIGTASPTTMLQLSGSAAAGKDPTLTLNNTTASTGRNYQIISGDGGPFRIYDATAAAERMRIDSSGNVGIGETSPTNTLDVKASLGRIKLTSSTGTNSALVLFNNTGGNAYVGLDNSAGSLTSAYALNLYHEGAYPIIFSTNNTRRATIDSSGNLLVGTTSSYGGASRVCVTGPATANQQQISCHNPSTSGTRLFVAFGTEATYTERGWIQWNGSTMALTNASDSRLKENIVNAPSALTKIAAMQIRSFDFKEDGRHVDYGVVAQELNEVLPSAVFEGSDNEDGSINKPWSVGLEPIIPILVKAIQEQQAIIQTLTDRITALEGTTP